MSRRKRGRRKRATGSALTMILRSLGHKPRVVHYVTRRAKRLL